MAGMLQRPMASAVRGGSAPAMPEPEASPAAMNQQMADAPGDMENVSAEEQAEYNRGMTAFIKVLHGEEKSQSQILGALDPKNPVGSVAQVASTMIIGIDEKIDLVDTVILPMVEECVPLVAEAAEAAGKFTLKPGQLEQAIATTAEALLDHYGMDDEQYGRVIDGMSDGDLQNLQTVYQGALNDG